MLENAVRVGLLANLQGLHLQGSLSDNAHTNATWLTTFIDALLTHCPHLKMLNLSDNPLGVPGALALARCISCLYNNGALLQHFLPNLSLHNTDLGDKGLIAFVKNMNCMWHPETLKLARNNIHTAGVSCLADAVYSGKIVIVDGFEFNLSGNLLHLEGALAVCTLLSSSHFQSTYINLSECNLAVAGGLPNICTRSACTVGVG